MATYEIRTNVEDSDSFKMEERLECCVCFLGLLASEDFDSIEKICPGDMLELLESSELPSSEERQEYWVKQFATHIQKEDWAPPSWEYYGGAQTDMYLSQIRYTDYWIEIMRALFSLHKLPLYLVFILQDEDFEGEIDWSEPWVRVYADSHEVIVNYGEGAIATFSREDLVVPIFSQRQRWDIAPPEKFEDIILILREKIHGPEKLREIEILKISQWIAANGWVDLYKEIYGTNWELSLLHLAVQQAQLKLN